MKEERYVSGVTRYPPLLSPLLVKRTTRGMRLVITGFTGPYVLPDDVEQQTDHLVHVVAGSGAVPNFAMVKWALVHCPSHQPHLDLLQQDLAGRHLPRGAGRSSSGENPSRLRVVNLADPGPGHPGRAGGLEGQDQRANSLNELVPDPRAGAGLRLRPRPTVPTSRRPPRRGARSRSRASSSRPWPRMHARPGSPTDRIQLESWG